MYDHRQDHVIALDDNISKGSTKDRRRAEPYGIKMEYSEEYAYYQDYDPVMLQRPEVWQSHSSLKCLFADGRQDRDRDECQYRSLAGHYLIKPCSRIDEVIGKNEHHYHDGQHTERQDSEPEHDGSYYIPYRRDFDREYFLKRCLLGKSPDHGKCQEH